MLASATINVRLCASRKLMVEGADNGLIDSALAAGISRVKGVRSAGVRIGNWLSLGQVNDLTNVPPAETRLKGKRDAALLALLIGCGLRRAEASNVTFEHIQQRQGRWVIVDMRGKGNRIRSVPMPAEAKEAVDIWPPPPAFRRAASCAP